MIYALGALLALVLGFSVWLYYRGRKDSRGELELEQVQELGDALQESEDDLDQEVADARAAFDEQRRKRLRGN